MSTRTITPTLAVVVLATVGTAVLLARPAAGPAETVTASSQQPAVATEAAAGVTIEGFAFSSGAAAPGAAVEVRNVDGVPHTLTATDGAFDTGSIGGGATGAFTAPTAPGTYAFLCAIHPSMTGQLVVG